MHPQPADRKGDVVEALDGFGYCDSVGNCHYDCGPQGDYALYERFENPISSYISDDIPFSAFGCEDPLPQTVTIYCDNIYLKHKTLGFDILVPEHSIQNFEEIIINGYKFKRDA